MDEQTNGKMDKQMDRRTERHKDRRTEVDGDKTDRESLKIILQQKPVQ